MDYAQIGNGGAETNMNSEVSFSETGTISVTGDYVSMYAGSGAASYVQIGDGGYRAGANLVP